MARRFWYKNSDKFHPTTSKPLQMFQKMFSTTFEERSESVKTIKRDESHLNHDMEAPVRLHCIIILLIYSQDVDPLNEMKRLIEKQECDISELKATVQEILSSVQNPTSGLSQFQSKSVKSMKFRLKKAQLDNPSDSNFADDNAFPLLP